MIFDEAHNIEKMCEESASHELRSTDLALCIEEVTQVRNISLMIDHCAKLLFFPANEKISRNSRGIS